MAEDSEATCPRKPDQCQLLDFMGIFADTDLLKLRRSGSSYPEHFRLNQAFGVIP